MLDEWTSQEGLSWAFPPGFSPFQEHYTTAIDDTNVWWKLFKGACEVSARIPVPRERLSLLMSLLLVLLLQKVGTRIEAEVFPAGTDSRYLRQAGIPALGFSPMNKTEILLHEHNERLHQDTFLRGIDVYETIFKDLFAYV